MHDLSLLLGPNDVERLTNSTNHRYGVCIAQELNFMSRQAEDCLYPSSQATFMITEQRRIQSPISTRVLERLLLLVWICAIITISAVRTRNTLPSILVLQRV